MASVKKTRKEVRDEVVRLIQQDPDRSQNEPVPPVGEPFPLQSPRRVRDQLDAGHARHCPPLAHGSERDRRGQEAGLGHRELSSRCILLEVEQAPLRSEPMNVDLIDAANP